MSEPKYKAPYRIYLQPYMWPEVSWCETRIDGTGEHPGEIDVEYIRADLLSGMTDPESLFKDIGTLLRAFDDGLFVRDTRGDSDPGWSMKLIGPLSAMARLQIACELRAALPKGEE